MKMSSRPQTGPVYIKKRVDGAHVPFAQASTLLQVIQIPKNQSKRHEDHAVLEEPGSGPVPQGPHRFPATVPPPPDPDIRVYARSDPKGHPRIRRCAPTSGHAAAGVTDPPGTRSGPRVRATFCAMLGE